MGYRLPLDSQAWVAKAEYPWVIPTDPSQMQPPLPEYAHFRMQYDRERRPERSDRPQTPAPFERIPRKQESAPWITRTAMCAEARNGVLYIFMPPVRTLEDYLELVAAVESTAESLRQPVLLEGYEPPKDARLAHFRITPDPGVIEVNIHPSSCWDELSERTNFVYEAARESRLSTEKFMLDGRHTGTGGGNHFVLGVATRTDSPWLRRPDLLRSLLT
jgi:uncharacterized protein (DUF2126 family)